MVKEESIFKNYLEILEQIYEFISFWGGERLYKHDHQSKNS